MVPVKANVDAKFLAVALLGVVGLYLFAKHEAKAAAAAVGGAINPVSKENIFYKGTSALVEATAGQAADGPKNLGEWIFSKTDPAGWATFKRKL